MENNNRPVIPVNSVYLFGLKTIVRGFERIDCDRMSQWGLHRDPLLAEYNRRPSTSSGWDEWFRERVAGDGVHALAVDSYVEKLVGWITLSDVSFDYGRAVLGIELNPDCVHEGFGSDAIRTLLGAYFGSWNFRKLYLEVAAPNLSARRCYEKCGFVMMGRKWLSGPRDLSMGVLQEDPYRKLHGCFRMLNGEIEILHYDMKATADTWRDRTQHSEP